MSNTEENSNIDSDFSESPPAPEVSNPENSESELGRVSYEEFVSQTNASIESPPPPSYGGGLSDSNQQQSAVKETGSTSQSSISQATSAAPQKLHGPSAPPPMASPSPPPSHPHADSPPHHQASMPSPATSQSTRVSVVSSTPARQLYASANSMQSKGMQQQTHHHPFQGLMQQQQQQQQQQQNYQQHYQQYQQQQQQQQQHGPSCNTHQPTFSTTSFQVRGQSHAPSSPAPVPTPAPVSAQASLATSLQVMQLTQLVQNLLLKMDERLTKMDERVTKLTKFAEDNEARTAALEGQVKDLSVGLKGLRESTQQYSVQTLQKLNALTVSVKAVSTAVSTAAPAAAPAGGNAGGSAGGSAGGMQPRPSPASNLMSASGLAGDRQQDAMSASGSAQASRVEPVKSSLSYPQPVTLNPYMNSPPSPSPGHPSMGMSMPSNLVYNKPPQPEPASYASPSRPLTMDSKPPGAPMYPISYGSGRQFVSQQYPQQAPASQMMYPPQAQPQQSADSDYEIARKLQEQFDSESRSKTGSSKPSSQSSAADSKLERCPVCGNRFPVAELTDHVNAHFDEQEDSRDAASSSVTPGGPGDDKPGFWSRLFGGGGGGDGQSEKAPTSPAPAGSAPAAPMYQPQMAQLPGGGHAVYYAPPPGMPPTGPPNYMYPVMYPPQGYQAPPPSR